MDLRRLRAGEILLALSGLLVLVSLFLPWYETAGEELSGWHALGVVDVLLALIALSAISVLVATAWMRVAAVPIALDALVTLMGLIGLVLMAFRVLSLPDDATGREIGLWLALAGTLGIVVSATISMRDERLSPEGGYTDATGRPVAAPPEIQLLPAARRRRVTLEPGIERREEFTVEDRLLTDVGGTLPVKVLSTPGMIAIMERCASVLAFENLPDGHATVGFEVCIKHVGAAAEGAACAVTARLNEVADGRKLRFAVEVTEGERTIGVGTHERRMVDRSAFGG